MGTLETTIVIDDAFQTYSVNGSRKWMVASRRWYALSASYLKRQRAIEGRKRVAVTAGLGRAYRTMERYAPRNRYGFKVDHTGRALY